MCVCKEVPNERNNATPSALVASRWAKNNPEASEKRTLFIYTAPNRFAVTELQNNIGRRVVVQEKEMRNGFDNDFWN